MKKIIILISLALVLNNAYSIKFSEVKYLPKNEKKQFISDTIIAGAAITGAIFINPLCVLAIPAKMVYNKVKENKPPKRKFPKCK